MTETEWLISTNPTPMLEFQRGKASDRKLRLFAVACCRCVWHLLPDERSRKAVETAEMYVDGLASEAEARAMEVLAWDVGDELREADDANDGPGKAADLADAAAFTAAVDERITHATDVALPPPNRPSRDDANCQLQCRLLLDIFGNPFRPWVLGAAWLAWNDSIIPKLAQTIYDERAFNRLPILADALEEAGCTEADILNHCRQPGEHARGCWVVDLLLGKE